MRLMTLAAAESVLAIPWNYVSSSPAPPIPFACITPIKHIPKAPAVASKLTSIHSAPDATRCCSSPDSRKCGLLLLLGVYNISIANAKATAAAHGQVHPLPLVTRAATMSRYQLAFVCVEIKTADKQTANILTDLRRAMKQRVRRARKGSRTGTED